MGKVLPEFLSKWTTERVREEGVNVIPNTEVQQAEYTNNQVKLTLRNGQTVVCDHVVVAVGSQPNTNLGKESGLEIEASHGGYLVNAELAARNNLYVVSRTFYLLMGFFDARKSLPMNGPKSDPSIDPMAQSEFDSGLIDSIGFNFGFEQFSGAS